VKLRCAAGLVAVLVGAGCHKDRALPTEPRSIEHEFGSVRTRWTAEHALWPLSRPVVVAGVVVSATGDARLVARDRNTGTLQWSTQVTSVNGVGQIGGESLVARSGVVMAAVSRNVVGVDIATGQELWSYGPPPDTIADPPGKPATVEGTEMDANDTTVFIPAWGASISAVNVKTGAVRWVWRPPPGTQFRTGGEATRVSGDTVLATVWHWTSTTNVGSEGWVVALDMNTGAELGRTVIPPYIIGNPFNGRIALYQNLAIVAGPGGRVWAIDRSSYAIVWEYEPRQATSTTIAGPVLAGDIIYTDSGDGYGIGLKAATGDIVWRTKLWTQATTDFLVTDTRVFMTEGYLLDVVDRATGKYLARVSPPIVPSGGALISTAAVSAGGQVYVSLYGGVWCFDIP
jgi:outer membrane protein assembly factor BamB